MGNCLVLHSKTIQLVRPDGKVLEYQNPVKVRQVLSDFSGKGVLETLPNSGVDDDSWCLPPEAALKSGHSYFLTPLVPHKNVTRKPKKKVRFADASNQASAREGVRASSETLSSPASGVVVRIKLVISKRELMEMMKSGGVSASGELMHQIMGGQKLVGHDQEKVGDFCGDVDDDSDGHCKGWKPMLETIYEK